MRKVDSDRIQSFHMQALRRILGIRWYDKVSNAVVNERTKLPDSYCWQTSFIIWSHLSPTGEHTCFAGTATVNRSPHQHSSRCWLEAPAGSSTEKLAAAIGRRYWPICWCWLDRGPGSFDVEDATTLSWSSAAVSEWVSELERCCAEIDIINETNGSSADLHLFHACSPVCRHKTYIPLCTSSFWRQDIFSFLEDTLSQ